MVGNRFDLGLLRAITGTTSETLGAALREGIAARLVTDVRTDAEMFEFRHAMIRDAVLDDLLAFERVEIARQALAVLERDRPELPGTLSAVAASLAEEAGDRARAAELLLLTGLRAGARRCPVERGPGAVACVVLRRRRHAGMVRDRPRAPPRARRRRRDR